jgi:hypothetical protein
LAYQRKTMFAQDANDVLGCANREALVDSRSPDRSVASPCDQCSPSTGSTARRIHVSTTSKTFASAGKSTGVGSNQSSRASFAFWIASSSVSPAEAQPGNSGKNAAQRFVPESCSTNQPQPHKQIIDRNGTEQKRRLPRCRCYQPAALLMLSRGRRMSPAARAERPSVPTQLNSCVTRPS